MKKMKKKKRKKKKIKKIKEKKLRNHLKNIKETFKLGREKTGEIGLRKTDFSF